MVIGIVIPFIQQHEFLLSMIEVFDVNEELIRMVEDLGDDEFIQKKEGGDRVEWSNEEKHVKGSKN
ncbi:hypothetical protein CIL05_13550 [Virgibacillus profundi]|uniref:Uncharacterized protein n=1 Tax=Virgibacillus profundi TaxID=2024555 RepID=A0A2A2IAH7_9BACI|nr:hypothetical protein [Virgibacillus profundi]PAV29001.1 hypothetical protein CIL05_13550 [Virgibacillus profundi]PXY53169.1 hypothetical protein CIT14_13675 [Virgibacillus profundi]